MIAAGAKAASPTTAGPAAASTPTAGATAASTTAEQQRLMGLHFVAYRCILVWVTPRLLSGLPMVWLQVPRTGRVQGHS